MDHYSSLFFYRTAGWNDRGALAPCRGTASYTRGKGICSGTTNHRKWCGQLFGRFSWTHRGTISWEGVHPPFSWSSRILFHEIGKHHWVEKQYSLLLMNFDCVCSPKTTFSKKRPGNEVEPKMEDSKSGTRLETLYSKECFIRYPHTLKLVKKTSAAPRFFNPILSVCETLSLVSDILHQNTRKLTQQCCIWTVRERLIRGNFVVLPDVTSPSSLMTSLPARCRSQLSSFLWQHFWTLAPKLPDLSCWWSEWLIFVRK